MTEQEFQDLKKRVSELEALTFQLRPLGPSPKQDEELEKDRLRVVEQILNAAKQTEPADRSKRCMLSGNPETPEHREIDPNTGMQKDYVVLCPKERAKGFVKPVRRSYKHMACGSVTTMGLALAETYARDPGFYSGTMCVTCHAHYPLNEFEWEDGEPMDPALQRGPES